MSHYQYQHPVGQWWAQQVYTSTSLVTPPANPTDTTKPAVAYNLTTREIDWLRDTASLVWRKAFNMDVLATVAPTATSWTVATSQDTVRIVNGTIPVASATYEWVILEVSWLTAPIIPTSWPLLNVWEITNGDLIICENSNGTWQWKKLSDRGGNEHLQSLTRAALLTLRTANQLIPWRDYEITDHAQGRLVAWTTVTLLATSVNELSHDARVNTTYDNTSRFWLYDIDTALVYELTDNRGNVAKWLNWTEVANFDWWNAAYTDVVVDNATLTVTIGNTRPISRVTVSEAAVLNLTGFLGTLNDFEVKKSANVNFTNANGTWRLSRVRDWGSFNASGYTGGWDNYYNEIDLASTINFSNSSSQVVFRQNHILSSTITHSWVSTWWLTFTLNQIRNWTITHAVWAWQLTVSNNEIIIWWVNHQTSGTVSLSNNIILWNTITKNTTAGWSITVNNAYVACAITQSSAWTMTIQRWRFENASNVVMQAWSLWIMSLTDCIVSQSSSFTKLATSTAGNMNCSWVILSWWSFAQTLWTWNITLNACEATWASWWNVTWWDRSYNFTRVTMRWVSRANLSGTWAWVTDNISEYSIDNRWTLTISCSWAANSILYWIIFWQSWALTLSWTTWAKTMNRIKLYDWSVNIANNPNAATLQLWNVFDAWTVTLSAQPAWTNINYLNIQALWSISINKTWAWTIQWVDISMWWTCSITWTTTTINELSVEVWALNISWGSITNCSKKMNSTWTITWWAQNNTHHWNATNKTTAVANTNRVDHLWVVSSVPIL